MEKESNLPFKVGDLAEARTFEAGFRGAWFRCKIKDITEEEGRLVHVLEYFDFPDEELDKMRVYQVPPYLVGDAKEEHEELMLRPHYPPICNKKKSRHVSEISVVVNNSWKVGDFVDMHSIDSYWSGRIKQLLGNGTAKIELNPPPLGEGSDYDALLKNIRPSLDWSPEHGWTVPTQEGVRRCAQLMKPVNQVGGIQNGPKTNALMGSTGSSARLPYCPTSSNSAVSVSIRTTEMLKQTLVSDEDEKGSSRGRGCSRNGETSQGVESTRPREYIASEGYPQKPDTLDASAMALDEFVDKVKWLKKKILPCGISSASPDIELDTLDAAVIVLEEYVNKVKWLKKMLQKCAISSADAETESTQWELE